MIGGGYSQLLVELLLFREVLEHKSEYNYVHLISGQDFPLKPIEKIIEECNDKKADYLAYIAPQNNKRYERRLRYYNILVPRIRQSVLCAYLRKVFLAAQMLLGINRLKKCPLKFEVGANWMSITLESLEYIVREYPKYDKYFRYGISAEECYKQMILETRKDARIVNDSKRYVIFEKTSQSPKTLTMKMLRDVERSDAFFARKFDDEVDKEVRLAIKRRIEK